MAVVGLLRLLFSDQTEADHELLHKEWKSLCEWLSSSLPGVEGWDYSLMDWPTEIPLFDGVANTVETSLSIDPYSICNELSKYELPWAVRMECLDRIQNGIMVGGDELGDLVLTKNIIYVWTAHPGSFPSLNTDNP